MLIFLAGLQSIPESVEEAAKVDGASTFQTFWHITIPLMKPTIFFVVTIGLISTWQVFDQIYATNFGGPQKTTLTPPFLTYFQSFSNSEAALGCGYRHAAAGGDHVLHASSSGGWINRRGERLMAAATGPACGPGRRLAPIRWDMRC